MSKFCQNCGSPISKDAHFCFSCGAKLPADVANEVEPDVAPEPSVAEPLEAEKTTTATAEATVAEPDAATPADSVTSEQPVSIAPESFTPVTPEAPAPKKTKRRRKASFWVKLIVFLIILAAIAAAVVYGVIDHLNAAESINKAIDDYVEAVYLGNGDALKLMMPEEYKDDLRDELDMISLDDPEKLFKIRSESMDETFGDDILISYTITDLERVSCFNDYYYVDMIESNHIISDVELDTIYRVKFDITIKGSKDKETFSNKMAAVEMDGNWYLVNINGGGHFAYIDAYVETLEFDQMGYYGN